VCDRKAAELPHIGKLCPIGAWRRRGYSANAAIVPLSALGQEPATHQASRARRSFKHALKARSRSWSELAPAEGPKRAILARKVT